MGMGLPKPLENHSGTLMKTVTVAHWQALQLTLKAAFNLGSTKHSSSHYVRGGLHKTLRERIKQGKSHIYVIELNTNTNLPLVTFRNFK